MLITKYKFNNTLYDLFPEFNSGFEFTHTDEVNGEVTTRTIESESSPTLIRFGRVWVEGETNTDNRTNSLLEVLDMNTSGLTSCNSMFRYCKLLTSITCNWDTSNVTTMYSMFNSCYNLVSLDVSNFDTSNVTTMREMFYNCNKLTALDVSNWDTNKVTSMSSMFAVCLNLVSLDVSNFDTSNATNMSYMFTNCNKLASLNVSNFNTSNVTNMRDMFYDCKNLTSLDVSNWNTSNVTHMGYMFNNCNKLTALDLSNWNTNKVNYMHYMFNNCNKLTTLDLSNFDTSNVTEFTNIFNNTLLLKDIGMLYCNASTIQKIINAIPTDSNKTLWYKEANIDNITYNNNIALKKYIEENIEIVLNSPLLEGDTIEIVDGKLCHVHKMNMVVLDGNEKWRLNDSYDTGLISFTLNYPDMNYPDGKIISSNLKKTHSVNIIDGIKIGNYNSSFYISVHQSDLSTLDANGFKQWLSENPTTVVYELVSPYYEDITPLQSSIALRTFEECNVQVITALPIKTKITYRTNITSAVVLEQELDTLDSGVSLSNLIEEEVDE